MTDSPCNNSVPKKQWLITAAVTPEPDFSIFCPLLFSADHTLLLLIECHRTSVRTHKSTVTAPADVIHLGNTQVKFVTFLSSDCSSPQGRSQSFEDKKRCLHRKGSKKLKPAREEICSLRQPHSGKMCPKCEILVCRKCETLHSESSFIAHSLLDHYDRGGCGSSTTLITKSQKVLCLPPSSLCKKPYKYLVLVLWQQYKTLSSSL
uniref:DUF4637 domain-containing protein n=1 Tax=Coturnix japonica TaxID=93934 RepID=A0A8C2SZ50_COTJA